MPNCSDTGGLKVRASWKCSSAKRLMNESSLSQPRANTWAHPTQQIIEPATSTWGENGYFEVWLDQSNAWIYPQLHVAAQQMSEVARRAANECSPLADRVLKQLARELLL